MKKLIASILILVTVFTLSACSLSELLPPPTPEEMPTVSAETLPVETAAPVETESPTFAPQAISEPAPAQNNFRNDTNFAPDLNSVSVKPKYVRYEDGTLVADCFVINGYNHTVYNISVDSLEFYDASDRLIASGEFGELQDLVLGPNQYVVWTFRFAPETVASFTADMSSLNCRFNTANNY